MNAYLYGRKITEVIDYDADGLVTVRVENWISPFIGRTEDIEIMEGEE